MNGPLAFVDRGRNERPGEGKVDGYVEPCLFEQSYGRIREPSRRMERVSSDTDVGSLRSLAQLIR
jgi:hypothetical protein